MITRLRRFIFAAIIVSGALFVYYLWQNPAPQPEQESTAFVAQEDVLFDTSEEIDERSEAETLSATTEESTTTSKISEVVEIATPSPEENDAVPTTTTDIPESEKASTTDTVLASKISWGVFTGSNKSSLDEFEKKVENNPDYLAFFVHWGNHEGVLPSYVRDYAYKKDRTLILFWEASDYIVGGTEQPAFAHRNILKGDWDEYIENFAEQMDNYGGPIILVPFSELNGDWNPWSGTTNGNTPEEVVESYRYVHSFFDDVDNVSFGLAVNRMSVPNTPENAIERYYPGDEYVDYVGVDGFNKGNPWLSFSDIFDTPLHILKQYNKPTFIFSFASAEGPLKAGWLDDALNTQLPKYPWVKAWIYFNQDKERNWLLWSDSDTFEVFKEYISEVE